MKDIKINFQELEKEKQKNFQERLRFIDYWVKFIKEHSDKEWSEQQNMLIDAQIS
jgi:hypothetical protein